MSDDATVGSLAGERRMHLLGCPIDAVSLGEAVERAGEAIALRSTCQHVSINAAKIVKFQKDAVLRDAVRGCELITADGQAVVWAGRVLRSRLPERVAGIDLMHALFAEARERAWTSYLLGAREEVVERAREEIRRLYPGVSIVGARNGYFSADEEAGVVRAIAEARPDMLFVALETPAKELFLARNREALGVPFVMGVGGSFDVLAGKRRRAPAWMQRAGLEWLYRLAQDPRRLAGRYVHGNSAFVWLVLQELVRPRLSRS
jgi:N-acetylglucosaminyldiphosphoundecaprenol N-acetyl-beta-D-mannosaminyltransferase